MLLSLEYYMGEILKRLPIVLLAGIVCAFILRKEGRRLISCRSMVLILVVCYMAGLLSVTALPSGLWSDIWYRLRFHHDSGIRYHFFTFNYSLRLNFWKDMGVENWGNLALFVPLGLFLPLLWKKAQGWRTPALGLGLSLLIEFIQLFIDRGCDVNDLILNTMGAAAGFLLFLLLRAFFPRLVEKCREREL